MNNILYEQLLGIFRGYIDEVRDGGKLSVKSFDDILSQLSYVVDSSRRYSYSSSVCSVKLRDDYDRNWNEPGIEVPIYLDDATLGKYVNDALRIDIRFLYPLILSRCSAKFSHPIHEILGLLFEYMGELKIDSDLSLLLTAFVNMVPSRIASVPSSGDGIIYSSLSLAEILVPQVESFWNMFRFRVGTDRILFYHTGNYCYLRGDLSGIMIILDGLRSVGYYLYSSWYWPGFSSRWNICKHSYACFHYRV